MLFSDDVSVKWSIFTSKILFLWKTQKERQEGQIVHRLNLQSHVHL